MYARLLLILCLLLSCAACKKDDTTAIQQPTPAKVTQKPAPQPTIPLSATPFLSQPIAATVIESTNEALPVWRTFAKNRPPLIIVANTPSLLPVPTELRDDVARLLNGANDAELIYRSNPNTVAPLLLPVMSLDAALDAGWFSQVIWVFPTKQLPEQLELVTFKKQLVDAQIASPDEADSFTSQEGRFSGTIRGIPFTAAPAAALPPLEQGSLLHIDADYFKPLYSGEIKTPIYPLMVEFLNKLKERGWNIAAATVALSNQTIEALPLQTRFLGKDLAAILKNPQMLKESFPRQWERRGNALYLENFMQKEEIYKIYREMEREDPRDPDVKFGLYNISRQLNKTGEALKYLHESVEIDSIYALEYLSLSELALQKKLPEKAVEMCQLAHIALPDNPFILTLMVRTMLNTGKPEGAKALKKELAALNWSTIYYPQQAEENEALIKLLEVK